MKRNLILIAGSIIVVVVGLVASFTSAPAQVVDPPINEVWPSYFLMQDKPIGEPVSLAVWFYEWDEMVCTYIEGTVQPVCLPEDYCCDDPYECEQCQECDQCEECEECKKCEKCEECEDCPECPECPEPPRVFCHCEQGEGEGAKDRKNCQPVKYTPGHANHEWDYWSEDGTCEGWHH